MGALMKNLNLKPDVATTSTSEAGSLTWRNVYHTAQFGVNENSPGILSGGNRVLALKPCLKRFVFACEFVGVYESPLHRD